MYRSRMIGCGSYLPEEVVPNTWFESRMDTSDEWIRQRTGIITRHRAAEGELTSDLSTNAAKIAMERAGVTADQIDCIIVGTTTPDSTFPATATRVQAKLGMAHGFAFDLQAVCSGFMYALGTADSFIKQGMVKTALVIGAETASSILDYTDRTTSVLFGDGAGAAVLVAEEIKPGEGVEARGVHSTHLHSDGRLYDLLRTDGGPSETGTVGAIRMEGNAVFRHAVTNLAELCDEVLAHNGITPDQLDWLVPHQANVRIIEGMAKKLKMSMEQVVVTVDHHGNTSAASVPLALAEAVGDGRIKEGDLLMMEAFGGGFTWAGALVRYG
ncbi:MAG: ketoacyl-ACP synthase III [Alphaproteobacteria bacterium]